MSRGTSELPEVVAKRGTGSQPAAAGAVRNPLLWPPRATDGRGLDRNGLTLAVIMSLVVTLVVGVTVTVLYRTAVVEDRAAFAEFIGSQAAFMDAVAEFDAERLYGGVQPESAYLDTLAQYARALGQYQERSESVEILLVREHSQGVEVVLSSRRDVANLKVVIPDSAPLAAVMRKALAGETGSASTRDVDNNSVMTAFSPVPTLGLALVAKVDRGEVVRPYLVAGLVALGGALILTFVGVLFVLRVTSPLQRRLQESQANINAMFESPTEGMFLLRSGLFLSCNQHLTDIFGCRSDDLIGHSPLDFSPELQPDGEASAFLLERFVEQALSSPQNYYWQHRRADGRLIDAYVSLKRAEVNQRQVVFGTVHDVTQQRRVEAELRRAAEEISEQREKLAHASRLTTMGEMAASIAHEINQPLTAISNYSQACRRLIIKGGMSQDSVLEILEKSAAQAQRAGEVIHRLRRFVKRTDSFRELVDCNEIVREIIKLAEVDARNNNVQLQLDLADGPLTVVADVIQIQQVLLNLVRNGVEAMDDATDPLVRIVTRRIGDEVEVQVIDHGPGLTPEESDQIFDAFFTTKATGMGMGLSICNTIIGDHGGTLRCTPNPAGGAIFSFALQLTDTDVLGEDFVEDAGDQSLIQEIAEQ